MAATLAARIQQFYNAYFGRPADPAGMAFWKAGATASGDLLGSAIKLFGDPATPEFATLYPAGTSIESFLDSAYANMFNRAPDADGKKFWADAFRTWVANGTYTEGEARAQILMNVLSSADAQVGTNDKLSLTNKQAVADALTSSVKQFGMQADYSASLGDARALLANVDHTQASVEAAVGMIKYGEVVLPGVAAPEVPNIITTFPAKDSFQSLNLPWSSKGADWGPYSRDIVKFTSVNDAPFTYLTWNFSGTPSYTISGLSIVYVELQRDRIDLSSLALGVNTTGDNITRKTSELADRWNDFGGLPNAYRVHEGYFEGRALAMYEHAKGASYESTEVFVDVNGNGNLDPEVDMWFSISLTQMPNINESLFIF